MNKISLLSLLILCGCSRHYDWYIDQYLFAKVDNQSNYNVKMAFCTTEAEVVSNVETVPANQPDF